MAYETKPNTGSMFENTRKEKETHPDRNGSAVVVCPCCNASTEYWLNGWLKQSKSGTRFLSLSLKPKEQRVQQQEQVQNNAPAEYPADDPFASNEKPPF